MSDDTTMRSFRLTNEDMETLAQLAEDAKADAPPELARFVSKTSVLQRLIAEARARRASEREGQPGARAGSNPV